MPRTFLLGGVTYGTRKAVETKAKEILHNFAENEPIDGPEGEFLADLLRLHPKAAEKVGPGIREIYIVKQQFSRCFFVRRTDGSEIDFSIKKCLDGAPT